MNYHDRISGICIAALLALLLSVTAQAALWTPEDLGADLVMWLDAGDESTLTTNAGGEVSVWQDKSTNGVDAVQSDSGKYPTSGVRTNNGLNVLDCDGDDYMVNNTDPFIPASGDAAFFMVAEIDLIDDSNDTLYRLAGTNDFYLRANDNVQFIGQLAGDAKAIGENVSLTNGPFHGPSIYNVNFDYAGAGIYNAFIDGYQRGADTAYIAKLNSLGNLRLFANENTSKNPDGAMAEFVVTEDVTLESRQKIEGYLAHKWGLADNLPADHPYKSGPPTTGSKGTIFLFY